jgi:YggT family protein
MSLIAWAAYVALYVFFIAMWVRFVFDWIVVFQRNFRPRGFALLLAEASYTVTDPPLRSVRKVLPPLRLGGAAIDLGWSLLMIATLILMGIVGSFR